MTTAKRSHKSKLKDQCRRAKAPPVNAAYHRHGLTSKASEVSVARSTESNRVAHEGRLLDAKLNEVLGRADYVGDLMAECGFPGAR